MLNVKEHSAKAAEPQIRENTEGYLNHDNPDKQYCVRCVYDEETPGIEFDAAGECNYCKLHDQLCEEYPTGEKGLAMLNAIFDDIKKAGKNKKYDCLVGVSGGTDSSYLIHKVVEMGLRPLAVHYDNTWSTTIATENIKKVLGKLKVDLYTHVVDNKEQDDVYRSFLYASVPEFDASTDIGYAAMLYQVAEKFGLKYVIEGHSFRAEGVAPLGWSYMDSREIADIQQRFGSMKINTIPQMKLMKFLWWTGIRQIKKIRPLWYLDYSKKDARDFLQKEFDWEYYGGHHLENRISAFSHSYLLPRKYKMDQRKNAWGAAVRSGKMDREDAIAKLQEPPFLETELMDYFLKRLGIDEAEFEKIMNLPVKSYKDYKTYKKAFERLRPLFYVMYKMNLVPKSFYIKYTAKDKS